MDDYDLELLELQAQAIERAEYQRGVRLGSSIEGHFEDCPWCGAPDKYHFDLVASWNCTSCGYFPSADLYGGQYS